jgi:hypothetical protein
MRIISPSVRGWGCFYPLEDANGSGEPLLSERPDPERPELVPIAGISRQLQFFRVALVESGESTMREHLVISAHYPVLDQAALRSLASAIHSLAPGVELSFIVEDRQGWSRVSLEPLTPRSAAAIAVVKCTMGWDESNPFRIEAADCVLDVELSRADNAWIARVTP